MLGVSGPIFVVLLCFRQFLAVTARPEIPEVARAISEIPSESNLPLKNVTISQDWDGPVRKCPQDDIAALNQCLRLILSDLKPRLHQGVPELNLPPMDPLRLKTIAFRHGNGPIKLNAAFNNVEASGLSRYEASEFTVDMGRKSLTFDLGIPQMQLVGNYELSGNLFVFPIGGNGNFLLHLVGVRPRGRGVLEIVPGVTGQKSLQLKTIDLDLNIEGMKVHLSNLFNGDKFLGPIMNNFINENSREIFAELRPQITKRVGEMVKTITNKALGALSSKYFDDLPTSS